MAAVPGRGQVDGDEKEKGAKAVAAQAAAGQEMAE
jgi:hypothetical protein